MSDPLLEGYTPPPTKLNIKLLIAVLVALSLALTCVYAIGYYTTRELNVENFEKIEPGMTQSEVEQLLGGPPGHYGRNWGTYFATLEGTLVQGREEYWTTDNRMLEVYFDENDKVVGTHQRAGYAREPLIDF